MARKLRIHFPGALYHVIARGNRGQKIFRDDQDYQRYLDFLREYREDFYELMDQRFLGTEEFVEDIRRDLNERPSFVYDISIEEIVSGVCLVFNISKDLLYSNTRNRPGALGRSVVGYLSKKLANHPFKETAEHFNRDHVVISKGIKGLEKRIVEDETISTAISVQQESLTKNRKKYSFS